MIRFLILLSAGFPASFAAAPVIDSNGIVNGASFASGPISPGSIVSIFGGNFAPAGSIKVLIGGVAAPVIYAGQNQVDAVVPWELIGQTETTIVVNNADGSSAPSTVKVATSNPGIFTLDGKQGVILRAALRSSPPAFRGEYLRIYATGLGAVSNRPATGIAASDSKLSNAALKPTVTIGGVPAIVGFAGLAPQGVNPAMIGVYQLDVLVPASAPEGDAVPVVVTSGSVVSNTVTLAIQAGVPAPYVAWTQLAPEGAIARTILAQTACPDLMVDGQAQKMQVRAVASLPFYPVTVCETPIPETATTLSIAGQILTPPKKDDLARIAVMGDTGCRIESGTYQACNNGDKWPTYSVAQSAGATKPDLLIHNGDYVYRSIACPAGNAGCAGSPYGFNWDAWNADFFEPFRNLLSVAPWFFVRGNHELCSNAGDGWFRFLDPRPLPATCQDYTDPFAVMAGSLQLIHFDSAVADDANRVQEQIDRYKPQFDMVQQLAGKNSWLMVHRPLWAIRPTGNSNVVMQAASANTLPDGVNLVISGHTHIFETFTFDVPRPPQVVIGNSGANLAAAITASFAGQIVGEAKVTKATALSHFGFSTITPSGDGWTIVDRDVNGVPVATCNAVKNDIACDK